jgi:hypothetical protein
MFKIHPFRVLGALALGVCLTGCGKSGGDDAATSTNGPVELKMKWPVGRQLVQEMDMKDSSEFRLPKEPAPRQQEMSSGQQYRLTVVQAEPDGGHEVELEFLRARMKMAAGGRTIWDFDSDNKAPSPSMPAAANIFGKFVGAKIRYFLDASNNVVRLEGVEDLLNRVSAGVAPQEVAPFRTMLNDGYFKQMMSQNLYLPQKPVQPGDTWPVKLEIPLGTVGSLEMNMHFTFRSWETHAERTCARLDFDGTVRSSPPKPGSIIQGMDGTLTGTSWFDPKLGIISDNKLNEDISMVMAMKGDGNLPLTNHMIQTMDLHLVSVK